MESSLKLKNFFVISLFIFLGVSSTFCQARPISGKPCRGFEVISQEGSVSGRPSRPSPPSPNPGPNRPSLDLQYPSAGVSPPVLYLVSSS
uniref:Uncharacterized protein n=1 Tax=Nelumbo nucifera TaxID=4432 RepID=A0A822ZPI5_NELNU|nr:TPA_asm: hypothetical protein HUJ06_003635 [Nelumbo nucifera]